MKKTLEISGITEALDSEPNEIENGFIEFQVNGGTVTLRIHTESRTLFVSSTLPGGKRLSIRLGRVREIDADYLSHRVRFIARSGAYQDSVEVSRMGEITTEVNFRS